MCQIGLAPVWNIIALYITKFLTIKITSCKFQMRTAKIQAIGRLALKRGVLNFCDDKIKLERTRVVETRKAIKDSRWKARMRWLYAGNSFANEDFGVNKTRFQTFFICMKFISSENIILDKIKSKKFRQKLTYAGRLIETN